MLLYIKKENHWLELIAQCRSSGLTGRQWCIENGIPVSTFYYHVRALSKKPVQFRKKGGPEPTLGNGTESF